ncbi:crossover junction endodeoxyribonuclease RuvC [Bdellovibrio bacteriovorus]|uniref:Crossover junction endodeoxyribonuclease RuvC n=1 Tax=Bdellovibrio bacteriovorus TaxID=959 RepID=A0A150WUV3_BDEBC|nr:crossover junction endodeoxyribonuclease RuvC [Bdellovibrio bacteriovorus]KYG67747.1 Holliday junction resolvase [Bdellovibrio bacteriovorus]KYG70221.1 Holliday junction resolvase [Bdellovibrio bacteriovorus]
MSVTILGVDPGSRITGFGVIRVENGRIEHINHGVILLDADQAFPYRMKELGSAFREVMTKYQPDQVVIEKIFLGKNADSAFKLGHARGVVMYEAGLGGSDVFEYATRVVKKGVTGTGGASKEDVQAILKAILNIKVINRIDASDALAMACHHAFEIKKKSILQRAVSL